MTLTLQTVIRSLRLQTSLPQRSFHVSAAASKSVSGRYKATPKQTRPLTYEMANPPNYIAHRKAWNSWNTSNILGGNRPSETAIEDVFIRRFMIGTWHNVFASEIIIKRQHNIVRIAGIIKQNLGTRKVYFLIGYTEEFLSYILQCPVKLELQSITDPKSMIFTYV
ncbi:28S ribosomal protein S24, mitochondrial [Venturia canescens]|uniref:28S ribosomal protein S24, mitochondrial n=1 Tax=Venturia canescens TaxID=32260 RepID=UPI001C9CEE14|nr:28S ribosomal protein S24, mitochondrial [Venturia canescens]